MSRSLGHGQYYDNNTRFFDTVNLDNIHAGSFEFPAFHCFHASSIPKLFLIKADAEKIVDSIKPGNRDVFYVPWNLYNSSSICVMCKCMCHVYPVFEIWQNHNNYY